MGQETCRECGGSGYIECTKCEGSGEARGQMPIATIQGIRNDCPKCDGEGVITCPICKGKGYLIF